MVSKYIFVRRIRAYIFCSYVYVSISTFMLNVVRVYTLYIIDMNV